MLFLHILYRLSIIFFSFTLTLVAAEKPNIILIYTDDVGFGDVACYEGAQISTPHINSLAEKGIRFTDTHCSAAKWRRSA